jgi:hypothetical protein
MAIEHEHEHEHILPEENGEKSDGMISLPWHTIYHMHIYTGRAGFWRVMSGHCMWRSIHLSPYTWMTLSFVREQWAKGVKSVLYPWGGRPFVVRIEGLFLFV